MTFISDQVLFRNKSVFLVGTWGRFPPVFVPTPNFIDLTSIRTSALLLVPEADARP